MGGKGHTSQTFTHNDGISSIGDEHSDGRDEKTISL